MLYDSQGNNERKMVSTYEGYHGAAARPLMTQIPVKYYSFLFNQLHIICPKAHNFNEIDFFRLFVFRHQVKSWFNVTLKFVMINVTL